ncbi:MAG: hypothetical protein ACLFQK_07560 [Fibrobacterota bacterium]
MEISPFYLVFAVFAFFVVFISFLVIVNSLGNIHNLLEKLRYLLGRELELVKEKDELKKLLENREKRKEQGRDNGRKKKPIVLE